MEETKSIYKQPNLILGCDKDLIIKNPYTDEIIRVGNKLASNSIKIQDYINLRKSNFKEQLCAYLSYVGYNIDQLINNKSDIREKWKDFWEYQIQHFNKSLTEYNQYILFQSRKSNIIINETILKFFKKHNKESELLDFISSIPCGESEDKIIYLLDKLLEILKNSTDNAVDIRIPSIVNMTLSKENQKQWLEDCIVFLKPYSTIEEVNLIYKTKVLQDKSFLGLLFLLKSVGVGRGEILLSYLIKDSKISGGGEPYDIFINGKKYEIKEYVMGNGTESLKDINKYKDSGSIRLGTYGNVIRFDFWNEMQNTISTAKQIIENSDEALKSAINKDYYKIWNNLIDDDNNNPKAFYSGMISGEIGKDRMNTIYIWYYFANEFVSINTDETITNKLSNLKYVKDPSEIEKDLSNSIKSYFNKENIDAFAIFRKNKIYIASPEDLSFTHISQYGIRIIENDLLKDSENKIIAKNAFTKWKKVKSKNYLNYLNEELEKSFNEKELKKQKSKYKNKNLLKT